MEDRLLDVREVQERLNLSKGSVFLLLRQKKLSSVRLGRALRIPASSVDRLIEAQTGDWSPQPGVGGAGRHQDKAEVV